MMSEAETTPLSVDRQVGTKKISFGVELLVTLVKALEVAGIEYILWGQKSLALYGVPTIEYSFIVEDGQEEAAERLFKNLGLSLCHGISSSEQSTNCRYLDKVIGWQHLSSHFLIPESKADVFLFKRSEILFNLPSLSALRPEDVIECEIPIPEPSHEDRASLKMYPVRIFSVARSAETYISLSIRDKKIGRRMWATWASIALYVPMYLDKDGCLGVVEKIQDGEARKMYQGWMDSNARMKAKEGSR